MNRAILVGNLTKDPELRKTQNDISVCTFTLAVNRRFANAQGTREADFLPIVVWRGQAESCHRYLHKGSRVAVCGTIQTRSYDAQDGTRRYVTEIVADEVEFITTQPQGGGGAPAHRDGGAPQYDMPEDMQSIDDDELPF
nr:single-stranded DNA-binding protein [Maliibacterium massiliense]